MIGRMMLVPLAAGLCLPLSGCVMHPLKEQVTTVPVPHVSGSALKVTAHNGHIGVKKWSGVDVQIIATLRMQSDERLALTTISANRDGSGALVVMATPPGGTWQNSEGCAFDITVPDARGVTLSSGNGRLEIEGLSGPADLKSSNGRITVTNQDGPVVAKTSNGRIEVTGATGSVDCDTSNGAVTVSLSATSTGPVKIDTSNGAITLDIGKAFSGTIEASTSNGSITLPSSTASRPVNVQSSGRSHVTAMVGSGGGTSTLKSSNGRITVKFAE